MKTSTTKSIILLYLAVVMSLMLAGTVSAADAISLLASEPATIYYTTNGEARTEPRFPLPSVILDDSPGNEARKAAVKAFKEKLHDQALRESLLRIGIFDNQEEMDRAELGERFQVQDFHKVKIIADDTPHNPVAHMRIWSNRWIYMVRVDGKARTTFFIDVGLGSAVGGSGPGIGVDTGILSRILDGFLSSWPVSAGYRHRILMNAWDKILVNPGSANKRYRLASVIELWQHGSVIGFFPLITSTQSLGEKVDKKIMDSFTSADLIESERFMAELRVNQRQPDDEKARLMKKSIFPKK